MTVPAPDDALYQACQHPGESEQVWLARWRLVLQMLRARTPAEVTAATIAARAWLEQHPGDLTVLSAGESLSMVASAGQEDQAT